MPSTENGRDTNNMYQISLDIFSRDCSMIQDDCVVLYFSQGTADKWKLKFCNITSIAPKRNEKPKHLILIAYVICANISSCCRRSRRCFTQSFHCFSVFNTNFANWYRFIDTTTTSNKHNVFGRKTKQKKNGKVFSMDISTCTQSKFPYIVSA